jgi:hypothetical protein
MREDAAALLERSYAEGYLSPATLEERLGELARAETVDAVRLTLADLPPPSAWAKLRGRLDPTWTSRRAAAAAEQPARWLDLSAFVDAGPVVVGRGDDCDLVLDDRTISRRHAELDVRAHTCRVRDLGSKNGTFAHGCRVGATRMKDGDVLGLGLARLRLTWRAF